MFKTGQVMVRKKKAPDTHNWRVWKALGGGDVVTVGKDTVMGWFFPIGQELTFETRYFTPYIEPKEWEEYL